MSVTRKPPVTAYARLTITAIFSASHTNKYAPAAGYMFSDNAGSCVETYQISFCPPQSVYRKPGTAVTSVLC